MKYSIKICGVRDAETARVAADAGADKLGVVLFAKSPRAVAPAEAPALFASLRAAAPGLALVALAVDPDDALIEIAAGADEIQLHGRETPERVAEIAARSGRPVWKAIGLGAPGDLDAARGFTAAAGLYFDARPSAADARPGGLGRRFDPKLLTGVDDARPWVLSGGLDPENVADAVADVSSLPGFAGVDVSSGVERAPGVKDAARVRDFIQAARSAFGE